MDNFRLEGGGFAEVSLALRRVDKELKDALWKEARAIADPVAEDMRRSVLALDSTGKSIGSSSAKRAIGRMNRKNAETEAAFQKRLAKNPNAKRRAAESDDAYAKRIAKDVNSGKHGLRASIARAVHVKIADTGWKVGVRVRVDGTKLPADQKYLPRGLDSVKGWRHPIYGTDKWAQQYGNPPGWFTSTAKAHRPMAERRMKALVADYIKVLAARIDRAA